MPDRYRLYAKSFSIKPVYSRCFITRVVFESFTSGEALLRIHTKNALHLEYLKDLLSKINWEFQTANINLFSSPEICLLFKLKTNKECEIKQNFAITDSEEYEIRFLFNAIFLKLKSLNIAEDTSDFFQQVLEEYFDDCYNNFPPLNTTPIESCQSITTDPNLTANKIRFAILENNVKKISILLRQDNDPNKEYLNDALKLAAFALWATLGNKRKSSQAIDSIKLLITYRNHHLSLAENQVPEEECLYYIIRYMNTKVTVYKYLLEVLCMLMSIPGSIPCGDVHYTLANTLVGQLISMGNRSRVEERISKTSMSNVVLTINSRANTLMRIQTHDNKKIKIERRYAGRGDSLEKVLNNSEKTILFNLFKKKMQIDHKTAINEFSDCFKGPGHLLMDLVRYDSFLLGVNIAEKISEDQHDQPIVINDKEIVIYHIRLSITSAKYDRLMSLVSFIEPFALQQQDPNRVYYTVWEASSYDSVRQIDGLLKHFYPKNAKYEDIATRIKDILYQSNEVSHRQPHYVKDKLSRFKKQNRDLGFYQQMFSNNNANNFWNANKMINEDAFNMAFAREGESPIIIFESNDENLEYFDKIISKKINRRRFKDLVKERAEQLNHSHTPTIRSNL